MSAHLTCPRARLDKMGALCHPTQPSAVRTPGMDDETAKLGKGPEAEKPAEFPLFSKLPPELRLKIWNLTLPSLRLVSIHCGADSPSLCYPQHHTTKPSFTGCTSDVAIPVNMHVCTESRAEAFKSFQYAFGFVRTPGHIIFNPDSDILYFGPRQGYMAADAQFHTCMSMCDPAQLALVRRIAVSDALFWVDRVYSSTAAASLTTNVIKQLASRMPALEHMIFVPREQDEATDPALTEERMSCQIHMAIHTVCQEDLHWRPPPWTVMSLRKLTAACG
ncbi:uncharacterized protein MAM_01592 [Metarhizium album ARSEF 1941]|uniref:2EXR domain-containing protein n=1 Tax=Metarhizium album (strain ARSEF 1941) TaxID=1081103 RepID=A0A0B2X3A8_METAS|nr:uncharacterized protein MAM_01592 [Metarhizium album ARSEF 1941]KHO00814.1 hypothetical protein MAM_01592 [Metarhizium album ARSEF 1941]